MDFNKYYRRFAVSVEGEDEHDPNALSDSGFTTYDFIVIGGGTAGMVVASRLSEDPSIRVLLLEAGKELYDDPQTKILGLVTQAYGDGDLDWYYKSLPQKQLSACQIPATSGKSLGESSAINFGMVYPSRVGMNAWEALGNPGWGWNDIAPYLRSFQMAAAPPLEARAQLEGLKWEPFDQGQKGPGKLPFAKEYTSYQVSWWKAFQALGWPHREDPKKGGGTGPFISPVAVDPATNTRSHAASAYLTPEVRSRASLRIVTGVHIDKLHYSDYKAFRFPDDDPLSVNAVSYVQNGKSRRANVVGEVILAAGAMQSPHILELSGIGERRRLRELGIPSFIDLPGVGKKLHDHAAVPYGYELADGMPSEDATLDPDDVVAGMEAFMENRSGPLSTSMVSKFMPYPAPPFSERVKLIQKVESLLENKDLPVMYKKQYQLIKQIIQDPNEPTGQYTLAPFQMRHSGDLDPQDVFHKKDPGKSTSIFSTLSYPLSRGSVHINSANPWAPSVIDRGILQSPIHLELHTRHSMWTETLTQTPAMEPVLRKDSARLHSPEKVTDRRRAGSICRKLGLSMGDVSGTCAMMPRKDGGVVDPTLKVYGTANIRVVDASIFPLVPRGNIEATIYAVAEKAAAIIKEEYNLLSC
ncbi:hypothetical protein BJX63DRAFT_441117 [Aspergillus granulosus]|uniref:Glucose-methanol-choline oxidoreductase N-terminal domain-containing protein n=1 Tax=Aspergillus granulosus TaxID=176169 RepID=A0ABR4I3V8_9EURO